MSYPKITSVKADDSYTLIVEFENELKKKYDVTPLLKQEMFFPLKDFNFFKAVQIEPGGYAVAWNHHIDISEYELWRNGQSVS